MLRAKRHDSGYKESTSAITLCVLFRRNHYICTVYAARMMVPRKSGLIINISSIGGIMYLFGGPAYGVGKTAVSHNSTGQI